MPRDREALADILDCIALIEQYTSDVEFTGFASDVFMQDAVVRRFEIMGEAAKRVSEAVREKYPSVPWKEMSSMRDRVIHGYDTVDVKIVWDTIKNDLAKTAAQIKSITEATTSEE